MNTVVALFIDKTKLWTVMIAITSRWLITQLVRKYSSVDMVNFATFRCASARHLTVSTANRCPLPSHKGQLLGTAQTSRDPETCTQICRHIPSASVLILSTADEITGRLVYQHVEETTSPSMIRRSTCKRLVGTRDCPCQKNTVGKITTNIYFQRNVCNASSVHHPFKNPIRWTLKHNK